MGNDCSTGINIQFSGEISMTRYAITKYDEYEITHRNFKRVRRKGAEYIITEKKNIWGDIYAHPLDTL